MTSLKDFTDAINHIIAETATGDDLAKQHGALAVAAEPIRAGEVVELHIGGEARPARAANAAGPGLIVGAAGVPMLDTKEKVEAHFGRGDAMGDRVVSLLSAERWSRSLGREPRAGDVFRLGGDRWTVRERSTGARTTQCWCGSIERWIEDERLNRYAPEWLIRDEPHGRQPKVGLRFESNGLRFTVYDHTELCALAISDQGDISDCLAIENGWLLGRDVHWIDPIAVPTPPPVRAGETFAIGGSVFTPLRYAPERGVMGGWEYVSQTFGEVFIPFDYDATLDLKKLAVRVALKREEMNRDIMLKPTTPPNLVVEPIDTSIRGVMAEARRRGIRLDALRAIPNEGRVRAFIHATQLADPDDRKVIDVWREHCFPAHVLVELVPSHMSALDVAFSVLWTAMNAYDKRTGFIRNGQLAADTLPLCHAHIDPAAWRVAVLAWIEDDGAGNRRHDAGFAEPIMMSPGVFARAVEETMRLSPTPERSIPKPPAGPWLARRSAKTRSRR